MKTCEDCNTEYPNNSTPYCNSCLGKRLRKMNPSKEVIAKTMKKYLK